MSAKKRDKKTKVKPLKVRIAKPANRPFQVRYTCPIEKKEIRISAGSRDIDDAEQLKSEIEAKLLLGLEVQPEKEKVFGPGMDWDSFREEYRVLHLTSVRKRTALDIENRLDIAQRIMKPKTLGDFAQPSSLQKLQAKLLAGELSIKKKPRSPHTVRGYMKSILAALNWAYLQDWLSNKPKLPRIKTSRIKSMRGRPITESEFQEMLNVVEKVVGAEAATSWDYVIRGLWESAFRIEELMHISWDQPGTIRPIWQQGQHPILEIPAAMQKNVTHETIPMLSGFESVLLETPESQRKDWVFNPKSLQLRLGRKIAHRRPDADWVAKVIGRIGKEAQIIVEEADKKTGRDVKFASAHDLRRSCGERLRNAGVPPLVICRVMRHSSWETTRKHYAPGNVQKDTEVLKRIIGER
ncbi:site-specific integrase [Gimesia aquarii]|uniref:Phage integrase family protein n=1 Tax=Gimesia aquarii TaxID=2527964 RepID=A0A517WWZ6_9PLAN|nr:site-specific integrase [Gimesia aquarii]QDU09796.1 Phage integrase family protein [Gimesia aquarii]